MVSGRNGRHHEAIMAATREEAMHPQITQAIAAEQVRDRQERAAARQRAAQSHGPGAGRSRRSLRWPGLGPRPASRAARPWRDRAAAVLVALTETQEG